MHQLFWSILKRLRRRWRLFALILVVCIGFGVCIFRIFIRCSPNGRYAPIIAQIQANKLQPDSNGKLNLPAEFHGIVNGDAVFISKLSGNRMAILFPTWFGRGSDIEGYVYVEGGLIKSDFYTVTWGGGTSYDYINLGDRNMLSVTPQCGYWYWVTRRLD